MKQCPTVSDAALYSQSDPSGDVRAQRYTPRVSGSLLTSLTSSSPSDCCSLLERGHNHLTHTDRETDRHVEYAAHVWTCCQSVCVSTCWLYCSVYYCPLQTDSLSLRLSVQPAEIWTAEPSEDKQHWRLHNWSSCHINAVITPVPLLISFDTLIKPFRGCHPKVGLLRLRGRASGLLLKGHWFDSPGLSV